MVNKVRQAAEKYSMFKSDNNCEDVVVALSGGADSVALLNVMKSLAGEYGLNISACHVNHGLREAAAADEAFVRELCEREQIPLVVRAAEIMVAKHQSVEEVARKARYGIFAEVSQGKKIAVAHTASDNEETVLFNLIRGTGLKGLCGIPPTRDNIIRPLILCERSEVEAYCREHGLLYVTDESNFSEAFTRNKIRLSLLPLIREINPAFTGGITRMCGLLREDEAFLESQISGDFDVKTLSGLKKPLQARIIGGILSKNNISPSSLRIAQIAGIVEKGKGKVNLKKNRFAVVCDNKLKILTIFQNYRK